MVFKEVKRTVKDSCVGVGQTSAQYAYAVQKFKTPLYKRALWQLCLYGGMVCAVVLAAVLLTGCVDMASEEADAANLRDAVAMAKAESKTQPGTKNE